MIGSTGVIERLSATGALKPWSLCPAVSIVRDVLAPSRRPALARIAVALSSVSIV
jgi:hypothetical protein